MDVLIFLPDLEAVKARLTARFKALYAEWLIAEERGLLKEGDPRSEVLCQSFMVELDEIEAGFKHIGIVRNAIRR